MSTGEKLQFHDMAHPNGHPVEYQHDEGEYPMEYQMDDWGGVAHEVTVDDEGEYIEVDGLDEVSGQYIDEHGYIDDGHGQQPNLDILPIGPDGMPLLTLSLETLTSKTHALPGGGYIILGFNRKCQPQLAHEGFLYTLVGSLNTMAYNIWRCVNPVCPGAMRTSPNYSALKLRHDHVEQCIPDELQIRMRIAILDIELWAEFVNNTEDVYTHFTKKLQAEQPDLLHIWPSYEELQPILEHHRLDMTYRKRFEARKTYNLRKRDGLVIEKSKFKRTKAFPPSICAECNAEFPSGDLAPSQDLLIQHLTYSHERPLVIERFTFPDPSLFENWIRGLSAHSRYRLRKVGLYDEHMYYLCCNDDRQQRCNHGRGTIIHMQCPAFIRVHDWRYILRREIKSVIVDYCLDHCFHTGESPLPESYRQPLYDYYSPELFMKELEHKQRKTAKMISNDPGAIKCMRTKMTTDVLPGYAVQEAPGDIYLDDNTYTEQMGEHIGDYPLEEELPPPEQEQQWITEEPVPYDPVPEMQPIDQGRVTFQLTKKDPPLLREAERNLGTNHVTVRQNFEDRGTFEVVMQLELQCDLLKQRMQHCRRQDIARRYLTRITGIVEDVLADPHCSPKNNSQQAQRPPSMENDELPGPSTRREIVKASIKPNVTSPIGLQAKKEIKLRQLAQAEASTAPVRQAMFLKRGDNGEMIVVKRVIKKVKKAVHVIPGEDSVVQPAQSKMPEIPAEHVVHQDVNVVDDYGQKELSIPKGNEMPANFLEPTEPSPVGPPPKRSQRARRPPARRDY